MPRIRRLKKKRKPSRSRFVQCAAMAVAVTAVAGGLVKLFGGSTVSDNAVLPLEPSPDAATDMNASVRLDAARLAGNCAAYDVSGLEKTIHFSLLVLSAADEHRSLQQASDCVQAIYTYAKEGAIQQLFLGMEQDFIDNRNSLQHNPDLGPAPLLSLCGRQYKSKQVVRCVGWDSDENIAYKKIFDHMVEKIKMLKHMYQLLNGQAYGWDDQIISSAVLSGGLKARLMNQFSIIAGSPAEAVLNGCLVDMAQALPEGGGSRYREAFNRMERGESGVFVAMAPFVQHILPEGWGGSINTQGIYDYQDHLDDEQVAAIAKTFDRLSGPTVAVLPSARVDELEKAYSDTPGVFTIPRKPRSISDSELSKATEQLRSNLAF